MDERAELVTRVDLNETTVMTVRLNRRVYTTVTTCDGEDVAFNDRGEQLSETEAHWVFCSMADLY